MHGVTFLRRCVPVSMLLYELFYYRMVQFFNANLKLDRQNTQVYMIRCIVFCAIIYMLVSDHRYYLFVPSLLYAQIVVSYTCYPCFYDCPHWFLCLLLLRWVAKVDPIDDSYHNMSYICLVFSSHVYTIITQCLFDAFYACFYRGCAMHSHGSSKLVAAGSRCAAQQGQ